VGSSREAHRAAQALANRLREVASPKVWPQVFTLSQTTIESLVKEAPTFDFAVFILSGEDFRRSRGVKARVPRDNIIFEIGLFMGVLGRDRVFLVKRSDVKVDLPSDFLGITTADYNEPSTNSTLDWDSELGFASSRISDVIERLGTRSSSQMAVTSSEAYLKDAAQYFHRLLVQRYGVSALTSSVSFIVDLDGSAIIRRKLQGIKVSGPIKIDQIPGRIAPGTRNGRITKHPAFIREVKFRKPVLLKPRVEEDNLSIFDVVIKGSLTQTDPKLNFEYESSITKSFLMTREEVEKAYQKQDFKYEYISLRMEMPTEKAELDICFPKGYPVKLFPGVFFGESESMHDSELNRVAKGFTRTPNRARFMVNKPVVGFNYIIYWASPSKNELPKNSKNDLPHKRSLDRRKRGN
jgi:hypothetical protein